MVREVTNTYYVCEKCGGKHNTRSAAEACESRPLPEFAYKVGQFIPEIQGSIVEQIVSRTKYSHVLRYRINANSQYLNPKKLVSQTRLEWYIERGRVCTSCSTPHISYEARMACEAEAAKVTHRWKERDIIEELNIKIIRRKTYLEHGVHLPSYQILILLVGITDYMSEIDLIRKLNIT